MKSAMKSRSRARERDESLESGSPREKRPRRQEGGEEPGDSDPETGLPTPGLDDGGVSITFARCLTEQQKFHLKKKMESELADLMGEKSTDGASRVVDDMFKEFLAEKMALIEAEKRKVGGEGGGSEDESESSREDGALDEDDADSKSDTAKGTGSSKSGKHKKHKKEKKKKKHKEKDKEKDKSKKHKHKDKDREKEKDKHRKSKVDKLEEELDNLLKNDKQSWYDKYGRSERDRERVKHSSRSSRDSKEKERTSDKHYKERSGDKRSKSREKDNDRRDRKVDIVKSEVPLVERRIKHKIHLDGDDFIDSQVSGVSGRDSADDEKVKRKHKHKEKRKDDSPDRNKEKSGKSKEVKEAKVKLEHLDDEEEPLGFTEKEENEEVASVEKKDVTETVEKTVSVGADSTEEKDDFKLPQRKVEEEPMSSVFERNISLKIPNIKPLEKYKELKKRDKLAQSEAKSEKKDENVGKDASAAKKSENSEKDSSTRSVSMRENRDVRKGLKGLPDMRLISVLPKRKVEHEESKSATESKSVIKSKSATEGKSVNEGKSASESKSIIGSKSVSEGKSVIESKSSSESKPVEERPKSLDRQEESQMEPAGNGLVISMNSEGETQWHDCMRPMSAAPKLDDIPLPVPAPSFVPISVPPPTGVQAANSSDGEESGKKSGIKIKLGSIRISSTSAALIQSGLKFDTKKQALLEEGELSGESDAEEGTQRDDITAADLAASSSASSAEDDVTDGEITSSDAESDVKKKKEKKKHKHKKKKKHKDKDKDKERSSRKKRTHSRSQTPKKRRHSSRSRSGSPSFDKKRGVWKERSRSRDREGRRERRSSRSRDRAMWPRDREERRSRSRERFPMRYRDRGFDRGFRPRSRSPPDFYRIRRDFRPPFPAERSLRRRSKSPVKDLRLQIDKTKLREIAIANAYRNAKAGHGPGLNLKPDEIAAIKAGGKSIDELTDFCKKIQEKTERRFLEGHESDDDELEELLRKSDEEDAPFIHHPFKVAEKAEIVMNIRNSRQLPVLTPADKMAQASTLRLQFPVSSGSQHHAKENEWVPVQKPTAPTGGGALTKPPVAVPAPPAAPSIPAPAPAPPSTSTPAAPPLPLPTVPEEQKVFPDMSDINVNIGQVVSERLSAMRKLQDNPNDSQAISEMYKSQQQMKMWAESKNLPGQFTGSTGVQVLSQAELAGSTDPKKQAWAKKDTFTSAQPLKEGIGMMLLQRMGWKAGEGLGKNKEGTKEPLMLDFKTDRRGLLAQEESVKKKGQGFMPIQKDLSGKHPVSALVELCNKRRWGAPQFSVLNESGPDHKKNFLFKVKVNGVEYQPSAAASTKKSAKMQAAAVCLQNLGLIPRDHNIYA